jgi:hypothetical protein
MHSSAEAHFDVAVERHDYGHALPKITPSRICPSANVNLDHSLANE